MDHIFQLVDNKFSGSELATAEPASVDLAISVKESLTGFVLGHEILMLNHKKMATFRINWSNIGSIKELHLLKSPQPVDQLQFQAYFKENGDNPYALQSLMTLVKYNRPLDNPTQLPPILFPKTPQQQAAGIDKLFELAEPFDLFFTFTRKSGVSSLIRYIDGGHWSHTGILDANRNIAEFTTSGASRSSFNRLKNPLLDVGLYRMKDEESQAMDRESQQAYIEKMLLSGDKYDWSVIPRSFLRKWLKRPSICPSMPSDLIRWNFLRLIGYA